MYMLDKFWLNFQIHSLPFLNLVMHRLDGGGGRASGRGLIYIHCINTVSGFWLGFTSWGRKEGGKRLGY